MSYSNTEYFNMLMCLGQCNCNYAAARRLYQERFARLALPSQMAFQRLHIRMYDTGSVHGRDQHRADAGRPRTRDIDIEEQVLQLFEHDPTRSTRSVAHQLGVNHMRVWRALSDTDDDTSYGAEVPTQSCKEKDQIEDIIAKVHDYFGEEYELLKQMKPAERLSHLSKISWRTARATGVSQAAVREVLSKQATRTSTKRQRPPQRPDERHQPPKKPRTARYKPKNAESSSKEDGCVGDEDDCEHSTTEQFETLVVKEEPETYNSSVEDSCGGDEDDGEHSTTAHVDEPEVYVQLAGVKTEPDACGDDSDEPEVYIQLTGVKTEPDACGDDSSDCETLAALSAAKRHKGSIKQRHAEAPAASSAPPSPQLPLPPDQQLTLHNPLTNQQGILV